MRTHRIATLALLFGSAFVSSAQQPGAHRINMVLQRGQGVAANVVPYANISVCSLDATPTSCTPVSIYSNSSLTSPLIPPVVADASGNYGYFVTPGCYDEVVSSPGTATVVVPDVCLTNGAGAGTGTVTTVAAAGAAGSGLTGGVANPTTTPSITVGVDGTHEIPTLTQVSQWNTAPTSGAGVAALIQNLSGCGTAGNVFDPADSHCVPAASMTYPAAGVASSSGTAWAPSYNAGNPFPGNFLAPFVASGSSHAPGAVPDPGATAGATRYLREDSTWQVPPGSFITSMTTTGSSGAATVIGGVLNIPIYGGGTGCTPTSYNTNDFLLATNTGGCQGTNGTISFDPVAETFTQAYQFLTPGFNFGNYGVGGSTGSTVAQTDLLSLPRIYGQSNYSLINLTGARKMSNGDFNGLNFNYECDGADPDFSAEGCVGFRNNHSLDSQGLIGVVSSTTPVTGGVKLSFSSTNGAYSFGAGRPVIDTDHATAVTVTAVSVSGDHAVATVTGATFTPSVQGTVTNLISVTANSNNTPTSTTFNVTTPSGCAMGQQITFGGPLVETATITAVGTYGSPTTGQQSITAPLRISHSAGVQIWCNAGVPQFADFPYNDINGQKMLFHVLGANSTTQLAIARQITAATDSAFIATGSWNLYHGGILIDPRDNSGSNSGNQLAVVSDSDAAWGVGDHAEVANGMYIVHVSEKDTSGFNNNPYSIITRKLFFTPAGDASAGNLNSEAAENNSELQFSNHNLATAYSEGGCTGSTTACWHVHPVMNIYGPYGNLAHFWTQPYGPTLEYTTTSAAAFNLFQIDDHTAYWQWNGPSDIWTVTGDNFIFGKDNGAINNTNFYVRIPSTTYNSATMNCVIQVTSSAQFETVNCPSGGGGSAWSALTSPSANLALNLSTFDTAFTSAVTTGTSDIWSLTDTVSDLSTGILSHIHTQSGSTAIPWQADANGKGWQVATDGSFKSVGSAASHAVTVGGGTPATCISGSAMFTTDSSGNGMLCNNGGTAQYIGVGPLDTTVTPATTSIAAASGGVQTCDASATTVTMTGLTTSMTVTFTPTTDPSTSAGWDAGVYINAWPSAANTLSYKRCNTASSASGTLGALTFNVAAK